MNGGPIDQFDDGAGYCTGTSMSAPIVAGILGMMRSANPNLTVGTGAAATLNASSGLREVLSATAFSPGSTPPDPVLGYGRPNAGSAVKEILGCVNDTQVKNRLTPLYTLKRLSMGGADIAEVADPHSYATLFGLWGNFANPPAPRLPTVTWSSGTNGAAGVYVFTGDGLGDGVD